MKGLMKKVREFVKNEEGQGLVEYALILALIAIIVIVALSILGKKVNNTYLNVGSAINS